QDGEEILVSGVGEILPAAEFYDYDAKYNDAGSKTLVGPVLPEGKEEEIRRTSKLVFEAVDGKGLARVDFFLEEGSDRVVFNEINTLPGFTSISMYPMLWEKQGYPLKKLVNHIIANAVQG
ncbi:MAG: D-alanine--D-alanine ligase A, partial [Oscillospiraceae bacterium]|nr:D-alanine--D-alanine ligase A [Oscillospiraceae bacterium]